MISKADAVLVCLPSPSRVSGQTAGQTKAFAIPNAVMAGADIYITGDVKYHDFYKAENKIIIADIGHYETEQFTKNLLVEYLTKKFTNFAVVLSVCNTNPVKYL